MITWLKYTFSKSDTNPYIEIEWVWWKIPEDSILSTEIFQLSWDYVDEITQELSKVKSWDAEKYVFWFETTMIWCYQKWKGYYWEKYPESEVTITYNYADDYIVTDLTVDDILKMMIDWRDYIDEWEKETGKIKK